MTYRARRVLFLFSILVFLALSGPLLLYTFGYRFSLSNLTVRETGGVFVHANPAGARVHVGSTTRAASFLTGNAFIQNLDPGHHTVTVSRAGFQQWEKTITVEPRSVIEISPVLAPLMPVSAYLNTASTTGMRASPNGSILVLRGSQAPENPYYVFDTNLQRILPPADVLSRTRLQSIAEDARFFWNERATEALIETPDDWLILTRANNTIRGRSLYLHSALFSVLSEKPFYVARDPANQNSYFILSETDFSRWNTATETISPLLQSIAGFSVFPDRLMLWDTQSNLPYSTSLDATGAAPYATSSLPGVTRARMVEHTDSVVLLADTGMWHLSPDHGPLLLTKRYSAERVAFTNAYILWWDNTSITIYWTLPEEHLPLFQKTRMETIYTTQNTIAHVAPYPQQPYIILQENNAIYTLELDGRGGSRNKHMLYEGKDPTFHVPTDEKILYILDEESVFTIELP